jgi:hypothetical protein
LISFSCKARAALGDSSAIDPGATVLLTRSCRGGKERREAKPNVPFARIRDLSDKRLYVLGKGQGFPSLARLIGGTILSTVRHSVRAPFSIEVKLSRKMPIDSRGESGRIWVETIWWRKAKR